MRGATTFAIVMITGAIVAYLLDRMGWGSLTGFALGVAYMLAAAVVVNSRRVRS